MNAKSPQARGRGGGDRGDAKRLWGELPRCGVSGVSGLQQPHGRTRLLRAGHTPRVLFLFPRHLLSQTPHISKPRGPKAVDPQGARPPLCTQSASCSHLVLSMEVRLGHPASKRRDAQGNRLPALRCSAWAKQGREQSRDGRQGPGQVLPAPCSLRSPDLEPVTASEQICHSRRLLSPGKARHDRRG